MEKGLQDKLTSSAGLHKGITEFLGLRVAGDPSTQISCKMVCRQVEKEERPEVRISSTERDGVQRGPEDQDTGTIYTDVEEADGPCIAETAPALGNEDNLQKACPPAQLQWGAVAGKGGSIQYVCTHLMSPNQDAVKTSHGGGRVETHTRGAHDKSTDHVLEGCLPHISEGWKCVNQVQLATGLTELAEAMVKQYLGENYELRKAIGQPFGDYLERVQRLMAGNCGKFRIEKVTERQVRNMIKKVDNKGSFGIDLVSYKDIKLLENFLVKPLTELINLLIETKYYPPRWKTSRVKPLWIGKENDKKKFQSLTGQCHCLRHVQD